ncbi:MAG: acyl-CoA thioesterase [Geobacteraceae bacterium]|nr:acyl-CoA thioesterase [Geobacteraceae bacterium]
MKYHETRVRVRFNEVDSYQVAWHGHYVAWMEIGRNDLAGRFDLDAHQVAAEGFLAPVVALELKYKRPARFNEELRVMTSVRRTETATLEFLCEILGPDGAHRASGRAVLVLTDRNGTLQYSAPPLIRQRIDRMLAYLEV